MGARLFSFVTFSNVAGYFGNVNSFWKKFLRFPKNFFSQHTKQNTKQIFIFPLPTVGERSLSQSVALAILAIPLPLCSPASASSLLPLTIIRLKFL